MRLTEKELKDIWRRLSSRPAADRRSCLAPEQLWVVAQGRLEGDSRWRTAAHLARCSDCSRELQLVSALGELAVAQGTELVARRRRPARAAAAPVARVESAVGGGRRGLATNPMAWASGALLLLFLIAAVWAFTLLAETSRLRGELEDAVGGRREAFQASESLAAAEAELDQLRRENATDDQRITELEDQVAGLREPVLNPTVVALDLRRVDRSGDSVPRQPVSLPPAARWFTLAVTLPSIPAAPSYSLELLNSRGDAVWRATDVQIDRRGFSISFPTEVISRGIYHLRLLAAGESGSELVEHIPLEITSG